MTWVYALGTVVLFVAIALGHRFRVDRDRTREAELLRLVDERTRELREANERLLRLSSRDALTGVANRRHLEKMLALEWRRSTRMKTPIALLMIDIDGFKRYNDTFGHQAGDGCLIRVAAELDYAAQRAADMAARYGGEEFVMTMPGTDLEGAAEVAERLRAVIEGLGIEREPGSAVQGDARAVVTVSIGVASGVPGDVDSPAELLHAADQALYEAKRAGGNRVKIAGR